MAENRVSESEAVSGRPRSGSGAGAERGVSGLFVPWTIRTMGGLFVPWTIRTMDYSYHGLFVLWTVRTIHKYRPNLCD